MLLGHLVNWYLDYSVSSGPFLRFSMRFEFISEMFGHSVCETRDPSLTKVCVGWWGGVGGGLFDYSVYSWPSFNQEWNKAMGGPG